jgi:hypothetical protein
MLYKSGYVAGTASGRFCIATSVGSDREAGGTKIYRYRVRDSVYTNSTVE